MTKSQLASNQLLMSLLLHKNKKNSILWSQLAAHMSNIKPIQPNKLTRTSKKKKKPSTTLLHWYMLVESLTGRLNFGGVDEEDMSYWTGTLITGCQSSIHHHLTESHLLDSISRHCGHTHAHKGGVFNVYNKSHKWLSGELPAVSRDERRLRRPLGHFPLSVQPLYSTEANLRG